MIKPARDHGGDIALLVDAKSPSLSDPMPFGEAGAAACRGRMLRYEDRMAAHRGLFAIVRRLGRRQPSGYEITCMDKDGFAAARCQIVALFWTQPETGPEGGSCEAREQAVEVGHGKSLKQEDLSRVGVAPTWVVPATTERRWLNVSLSRTGNGTVEEHGLRRGGPALLSFPVFG